MLECTFSTAVPKLLNLWLWGWFPEK